MEQPSLAEEATVPPTYSDRSVWVFGIVVFVATALVAAVLSRTGNGLGPLLVLPLLCFEAVLLGMGLRDVRVRRLAYGALVVCSGVATAALLQSERQVRTRADEKLERDARTLTDHASVAVERKLADVVAIVEGTLVPAVTGAPSVEAAYAAVEAMDLLAPFGQTASPAHQVGYALAGDPARGLVKTGPYGLWRGHSATRRELLDDGLGYDYTDAASPDARWYTRAAQEGPGWSEPPYYDVATNALLCEYTAPLRVGGELVGVAYASHSLDRLTDALKESDLGPGGYAFLLSRGGVLASYPNRKDVDGAHTLLQVVPGDAAMARIDTWLRTSTERDLAPAWLADPMTGGRAMATCRRLDPSGWALCTVLLPEPTGDATWIDLVVAFTTLAVCVLALALDPGGRWSWAGWAFSIGTSVAFSAAIAAIWAGGDRVFAVESETVYSDAQIQRTLRRAEALVGAAAARTIVKVPTGLLVTEVVEDEDLLKVSGFAWQRVAPAADGTFPDVAGVSVANAVEAEQELILERDVEGERVTAWRFTWSVADATEDHWYPISERRMSLDLVPATLDRPILLVPDIGGYDLIVPDALPGVAADVELAGWEPHHSGFRYAERSWPVDFGLGREAVALELPALRFESVYRLQLLNPLVTYLLPEAIVLVLMFALLLVTSTHAERVERYGLNASAAIGTYGTLFFIAVLEHISLRDALQATHLVYFEWFFIVTYVGLLLLTLDSLLVSGDAPLRLVQYGDNLLPRLLFWPLVCGSLFFVTVATFHVDADEVAAETAPAALASGG